MIPAVTIADAWTALLRDLLARGAAARPRNLATRELLAYRLEFDPRACLLTSPTRALNYRFAVAEWLWILFGLDEVEPLARFNSKMRQFSDDGHRLAGAYGPRLAPQLPYLLRALRADGFTRQAVATIWTPNPTASKDIPCTISLQFLLRGGALHGIVTMRSSDAWLGVPYDAFTFSQTLAALAGALEVATGGLTMQLGSAHLYEPHFGSAAAVLAAGDAGAVKPAAPTSLPPEWLRDVLVNRSHTLWDDPEPWATYGRVLESRTSEAALAILKGSGR